jgi:hypothetical protein
VLEIMCDMLKTVLVIYPSRILFFNFLCSVELKDYQCSSRVAERFGYVRINPTGYRKCAHVNFKHFLWKARCGCLSVLFSLRPSGFRKELYLQF